MSDAYRDQLMLIDGHSMAFRAFYALPDSLRGPEGEPVQAVYGFVNMLFRLLEDHRPRWLVVTFDEGRPFRHEIYEAYKAGREDVPDEVRVQVARLRTLLEALEIRQVAGAPFEADDYIASLTAQARAEHPETEVLVVSGDRDLFQLVADGASVLYPLRGIRAARIFDADAIVERFGVRPEQLRDFKAFVGDPSDNIPGVRGIGEKTAATLLQRHGDAEGVFAALDEMTPARRSRLEEGRDAFALSRELVTLRRDAPVRLEPESLAFRWRPERAEPAMRALGFDSTIERLPEAYRWHAG